MTDGPQDTGTHDATGSRRSTRPVVVVAAALVVAVLVTAIFALARGGDAPTEPDRAAASGRTEPAQRSGPLVQMAASPLSPRSSPVTAWTGTELVVVGGSVGGPDSLPERDGAAYDVATDSWRPIADAPAPVDVRQVAVWTGTEVVVAATTGVLAYDPEGDTWRTVGEQQVAPSTGYEQAVAVVTPEGILYPSPRQLDGSESLDVVLDEDGTFTSLPHDPFGASSDRSLAWDGERLWLLSVGPEEEAVRSNDVDQVPARLAVLEGGLTDGTWRVVDDETPLMAPEALLWSCEDRLVVDRSGYQEAQAFDRDSGSWSEIVADDAARCALSATRRDGLVGASVPFGTLGQRFTDVTQGGTSASCPFVRTAAAYVDAIEVLLVWDSGTTLGCRTAGPSDTSGEPDSLEVVDPCPDRLVGNGRVRFGFGPVEPAARPPRLRAPDEAYLCRYLPQGPQPSMDGPYTWESDLCCEAIPLTDAEVARLTQDLTALAPPEGPCRADRLALTRQARLAGPRYLLTLRTDDDLTGLVVDDFGCGRARLTAEPFELEPGTHAGPGGVVPGVLEVPDDLVERLVQAMQLRYDYVERVPAR